MPSNSCISRKYAVLAQAAIVAFASSIGARAEDAPVAKVYAEFEGGLVGADMAAVINGFSGGKSQILPTTLHTPAETVGLCTILRSELKVAPEFCNADLLEAIRSLNDKAGVRINPSAVNPKTGVVLPAVTVRETSVERLYNLSNKAEADRLAELLKNPAWSDIIQDKVNDILAGVDSKGQGVPQIVQLTIKRIAWQFDIKDPGALSEAVYVARQLSSRNLSVSVERSEGFEKAAHSSYSAADHLKKWCGPPPAPQAEGAFSDMAGRLYDTTGAVKCEVDGLRPEVAIMDQPIIHHPDLAQAFPQLPAGAEQPVPPEESCIERDFDRNSHHGTLLATIVASNANGYGFRGMAPSAKLAPFVWDKTPVVKKQLQEFIEKIWRPAAPQVFLFASEFAPYPPHPGSDADEFAKLEANAIWRPDGNGQWTDLLANELVRISDSLVKEIFRRKVLLVASAGQATDGFEGREIDWETPMSPQNLGDYENVVVVGACVDCDKPTAKMWRESNRSKDNNFVSLLAPGGQDVPTYVSDREVGETIGGTSAAAAFTAGLAAEMSACYPSSYGSQPENLKERIILASRPIVDDATLDRVAGGILDPSVSMLDPRKTWLKLNDQPEVKAVEFKHWCAKRLELQDEANEPRDSLNLFSTRRLTSVNSTEIVAQSVSVVPDTPPSILQKRIVHREKPGVPVSQGPVAAVAYEGQDQVCAVALNRMTDLFLAQKSNLFGDCEALPLCE